MGSLADSIASILFGRQGEVFANPLAYVSLMQQLRPLKGEEGTPGQMMEALGNVGLSPNPLLGLPMQMAGLMGDRPVGNIFRLSSPISALVGAVEGRPVEIEAPIKETVANLQKQLSGTQPFNPREWAIRKRLAEMSLEETGKPNHPEYIRAMNDPNHPLRRKAEAQVARESLVSGALSFAGVPFVKFLPETEKVVREARKGLPQITGKETAAERDYKLYLLAKAKAERPLASTYSVSAKDEERAKREREEREAREEELYQRFRSASFEEQAAMWRDPEIQYIVTKKMLSRRRR